MENPSTFCLITCRKRKKKINLDSALNFLYQIMYKSLLGLGNRVLFGCRLCLYRVWVFMVTKNQPHSDNSKLQFEIGSGALRFGSELVDYFDIDITRNAIGFWFQMDFRFLSISFVLHVTNTNLYKL